MKNWQLKVTPSGLLSALLAIIALSGCATQNLARKNKMEKGVTTFQPNPNYEYKIKSDDKINLSIWDHDNMSVGSVYGIYNSNEVYGKWLMVDHEGLINLPKYGLDGGTTVVQE